MRLAQVLSGDQGYRENIRLIDLGNTEFLSSPAQLIGGYTLIQSS